MHLADFSASPVALPPLLSLICSFLLFGLVVLESSLSPLIAVSLAVRFFTCYGSDTGFVELLRGLTGSLALLLTQSCGSFPGLQIGRSRLLREEPEQTSLALWSLQKGFQESPAVKVAKNVGFIEWPLQ